MNKILYFVAIKNNPEVFQFDSEVNLINFLIDLNELTDFRDELLEMALSYSEVV